MAAEGRRNGKVDNFVTDATDVERRNGTDELQLRKAFVRTCWVKVTGVWQVDRSF